MLNKKSYLKSSKGRNLVDLKSVKKTC